MKPNWVLSNLKATRRSNANITIFFLNKKYNREWNDQLMLVTS